MRKRFLSCLAVGGLLPMVVVAESAIFWVSGPVRPKETVLVTGFFPKAEKSRVRVAYLGRTSGDWHAAVQDHGTPAALVKGTEHNLMFVLPDLGGEGVYGFRVDQDGEGPQYGRVNLPEIWWTLAESGDSNRVNRAGVEGNRAQPSSTLRIFGRCLALDGKPSVVRFKPPSGQAITLPATAESPYAVSIKLPQDLASGRYTVAIASGAQPQEGSDSNAFVVDIHPSELIAPISINAADRGARGDGSFDNSPVFASIFSEAAGHEAVLVTIPPGSYVLSKPLVIPPGFYLQGESPDQTALFFRDMNPPPPSWIVGTHNFGLQNLSVYFGHQIAVISSDMSGDPQSSGHVRLANLRVRGGGFSGKFGTLVKPDDASARLVRLMNSSLGYETVRLSGPDLRIENCDLLGMGRSLYLLRASGAIVRGNTLYNGIAGWYNIDGSESVVVEQNRIEGADLLATGGSYSVFGPSKRSQNIYTAANTYARMTGNDGEAFTSDGCCGAYFGSVSSVQGKTVLLKDDPTWGKDTWSGALVAVMSGRGLGQWRTLESSDGKTVVLSGAFDIAPDQTSVLTIVPLQLHYVFYKNHFSDAGIAIQFFGSGVEHIAAENESHNAGGLNVTALNYSRGIQPEMNIQVLRNVISGMSYSNGTPAPSSIQATAASPSTIIGLVIRNNDLKDNSTILVKSWNAAGMKGILVEGNRVLNSRSVRIDGSVAAEVVVR